MAKKTKKSAEVTFLEIRVTDPALRAKEPLALATARVFLPHIQSVQLYRTRGGGGKIGVQLNVEGRPYREDVEAAYFAVMQAVEAKKKRRK
ncbi:MAG: hypothetical protein AAB562_01440 [Patescibacteria group bacterium]